MSDMYEFIDAEYAGPPAGNGHAPTITCMCRWLGVSKSGFYEWRSRPESATAKRQERLRLLIKAIFDDSDATYGYRRITWQLARQGVVAGLELVRKLMRELGLVACQPRPWRPCTTAQGAAGPIPDLVNRDFSAEKPGQKMVGDITYIATWQGWEYLATVIDCATRKVIGWAMGDNYKTPLITAAIGMAARNADLPSVRSSIPIAEVITPRPSSRACWRAWGSASQSGVQEYATTMRWRNRSTRRLRSSGCTGPSTRRGRKHGRILRGTSRSATIGSVSTRHSATGLRKRPTTST